MVDKKLRKQTQVLAVKFILIAVYFVYTYFNSFILISVYWYSRNFTVLLLLVIPERLLFTHVFQASLTYKQMSHSWIFMRIGRVIPGVQSVFSNSHLFYVFYICLFCVLCFKSLLLWIFEQGWFAVNKFQYLLRSSSANSNFSWIIELNFII